MTGNTLVIKIHQKMSNNSCQDVYIFYDHYIEVYGVRGCRYFSASSTTQNIDISSHKNKYSFFCLNDDSLNRYLKFLLNYENNYKFISMHLLNYHNLSLYSENITYDKLNNYAHNNEKNEILPNEIIGYEYTNKEHINEFLDDISNLFNILKNTWD